MIFSLRTSISLHQSWSPLWMRFGLFPLSDLQGPTQSLVCTLLLVSVYRVSQCLYELAQECLTQKWAHRLPWITACWLGLNSRSTMLLEFLVNPPTVRTWLKVSCVKCFEAVYGRPWFSLGSKWKPHAMLSVFHSQTWALQWTEGQLQPGLRWTGCGQTFLLHYRPGMPVKLLQVKVFCQEVSLNLHGFPVRYKQSQRLITSRHRPSQSSLGTSPRYSLARSSSVSCHPQ